MTRPSDNPETSQTNDPTEQPIGLSDMTVLDYRLKMGSYRVSVTDLDAIREDTEQNIGSAIAEFGRHIGTTHLASRTWLHNVANLPTSEYVQTVSSSWIHSAVARALSPGCPINCMIVLCWPHIPDTGTIRPSIVSELFNAIEFQTHYNPIQSPHDIRPADQSSEEHARVISAWALNFSEAIAGRVRCANGLMLSAGTSRELSDLNVFAFRHRDRFRPARAKRAEEYPRIAVPFAELFGTEAARFLAACCSVDGASRRPFPIVCGFETRPEKPTLFSQLKPVCDKVPMGKDQYRDAWVDAVAQVQSGSHSRNINNEFPNGANVVEYLKQVNPNGWDRGIDGWIYRHTAAPVMKKERSGIGYIGDNGELII